MAHILELPGLSVRLDHPGAVNTQLPPVIRGYRAWLQKYGHAEATADEVIEFEIMQEISGSGPFNPGDAAALFTTELQPIDSAEMERYFLLMDCSRKDLLTIVSFLTEKDFDWRPDKDSFTISRILRHIGNAEEWYVSRLVAAENLPEAWKDDEHLPILVFLEMERQTAVSCLRKLTPSERGKIYQSALWTDHPDESWTLRKVLRRFLEHEREHTAQIRNYLEQIRILKNNHP